MIFLPPLLGSWKYSVMIQKVELWLKRKILQLNRELNILITGAL